MTLASLLLFLLATAGLTAIVNHGKVAAPLRVWARRRWPAHLADALECPQCVGFWAGLALGPAAFRDPAGCLVYGLAGSTAAVLCHLLAGYLRTLGELGQIK